MIRINLIPVKRKKKTKPMPTYLLYLVLAVVVSSLIAGGAMSFMNSKVSDLKTKQAKANQRLKALDAKVKEVEGFKARKDGLLKRKKVIDDLTVNQALPVKILDEISRMIEISEGVWLTSMAITRDKVTIQGVGFSNSDIVQYVQNMKESEMFSKVILLGTTKAVSNNVETFTFNLSFDVKSS